MIKSCDHESSFICFEEADVCVRIISGPSGDSVFRVRVRTCCLRCGLGEPVGLRCVRARESKEFKCELAL